MNLDQKWNAEVNPQYCPKQKPYKTHVCTWVCKYIHMHTPDPVSHSLTAQPLLSSNIKLPQPAISQVLIYIHSVTCSQKNNHQTIKENQPTTYFAKHLTYRKNFDGKTRLPLHKRNMNETSFICASIITSLCKSMASIPQVTLTTNLLHCK